MKNNYFEGWYFKHSKKDYSLAFIPSYHVDEKGKLTAFIQVIDNDNSYAFEYSSAEFLIDKKDFIISMGHSIFTKKFIDIKIEKDNTRIKGELIYSNPTPLKYDIMGPFACVPFMQCRHRIISLHHLVNGFISINKKRYEFYNDMGYMESDRGSCFPEKYLWSQCNINKEGSTITVSIASVKALCVKFLGCIGVVYHKGKEYRLATYLGAKVLEMSDKHAIIEQGNMKISIEQLSSNAHNLKAPEKGIMKRIIRESPACRVHYIFTIQKDKIIDEICPNAGFEYSDNTIK